MNFKKIVFSFLAFLSLSVVYSQKLSSDDVSAIIKEKKKKAIKEELISLIDEIDNYLKFSSIRISGGPVTRRASYATIPNFYMLDEKYSDQQLKELLNDDRIYFAQHLYDKRSTLNIKIPYSYFHHDTPYDDIKLGDKQVVLKTVYTQDKPIEIDKVYGRNGNFMVPFYKKIDSVSLSITYPYLESIEKVTLSNEQPQVKEFKLSFIKGSEVEFTQPYSLKDKILYVEALDQSGKAIKRHSYQTLSENTKVSKKNLIKIRSLLQDTVDKINSRKIKSKKKIINYISQNFPEIVTEKEKPSVINYSTYATNISSINIYYNPVIKKKRKKIYLKNKTKYNGGLTSAHRIYTKDDEQYALEGLINEKGEWVIEPEFHSIKHKTDNIYCATTKNERNKHYYYLNRKNLQLEKLPYFVPFNNYYNNKKYVEITNSPYNNLEKGLLEIGTMKVLLYPFGRRIRVNDYFYVSVSREKPYIDDYQKLMSEYKRKIKKLEKKKSKGENHLIPIPPPPPTPSPMIVRASRPSDYVSNTSNNKPKSKYPKPKTYYIDVYRFSDHKKILSSKKYDDIILDNDKIILKEPIQPEERERSDDKNFYRKFHILDKNGRKLNRFIIKDIAFPKKFENGYMLVTDKSNKTMFVDRYGRKASFDVSKYYSIKPFKNGVAQVCVKHNRCGFINTKGEMVIPAKYSYLNNFINGYAKVKENRYEASFLINSKGEKITTFPKTIKHSRIDKKNMNKTYIFDQRTFNYKGEETTEKK